MLRNHSRFWFCSLAPGIFGNQQQQNLGLIKAMLTASLVDNSQPTIQALAVKATSAFVLLHDNEASIQKNFADLLPHLLRVSFLNILFVNHGYGCHLIL